MIFIAGRSVSLKLIIGSFILLLLVIGGGVAFFLSQQEQDIRQEAAASVACTKSGADIMLVIDISGSMLERTSSSDPTPRITRAKEAANIFADKVSVKNSQLPVNRKSRVGISTISSSLYDPQFKPEISKLVLPLTENLNQVKSSISALKSSSGNATCIECGIRFANTEISQHGRTGFKKVEILMTDGQATHKVGSKGGNISRSLAEPPATQAAVEGHAQNDIVYYVIGLGSNVNTTFLKNIAQQTGGKYYAAPTANDLDDIYREIEETLGKGTISGTVFNDINNNKTKDANENGLVGWTVNLKKADGSNVGSVQTNATGDYILESVCDGGYKVELTPQATWEITSPTNPNYHTITIQNGIPVNNINFGVNQAPTLTLTGDPLTISSGNSSTLTWTSTNTTSCTASNGWNGTKTTSGTQSTGTLSQTTTFTITCTGSSGVIEKSVTVIVNPLPTSTPSPTTPLPTLTPSATPISVPPTSTPTSIPITLTPTAVPTTPPTNTPAPTSTPIPEGVNIRFTALLHGIGSAGDNQNPASSLSNKTPLHPSRTAVVEAYDNNNQKVAEASGTLTYDAPSGKFQGIADFGTTLTPGNYLLRVKTPQYLRKSFPGITTLVGGDSGNNLPEVALIAGDVNGDNVLNILDYNLILGCYSDLAPAKSCTAEQKLITDINDDGVVNQHDYNLFLRELSIQTGD